jgi:L-fuculokinase
VGHSSRGYHASVACTAVLDVGKTNAKLCALDESGALVFEVRRAFATLPGPPYPHLDVDAMFAWAIEGLARIAADHAIETVVPVAHGACAALVSDDTLALPVLDYAFEGVGEYDRAYEALARDFAHTRSPRLPAGLNLGRQLYWLERRFPAEFARTTDILLWPQYWAWRLSGAKQSEVTSLGCHTDLWQPEARAFSSLARERGWAARFPKLVPAWQRTGNVLAGVHDSNASFLAHRADRTEPFAVVSTGTWFVCLAYGAPLGNLDERDDMLANVDVHGDPVPTARFIGQGEYGELAACTARCLAKLGARGDVIVEGPFARADAYGESLAALLAPQPVFRSDDATGTLAGALRLATWPVAKTSPRLTLCRARMSA